MGKAFGKILGTVLFIVFLGVIIFIGFTAFLATNSRNTFAIGKYSLYVVLTESMKGTFDKDSLILVKAVPENELAVGDIITYYPVEQNATILTHRIVDTEEDDLGAKRYVTKGDANNVNDSPVTYKEIIGKVVFYIDGVGKILLRLRSPLGIVSIVVITAALLIVSNIMEKNKKNKKSKDLKEKVLGKSKGTSNQKNNDPIGYSFYNDSEDDEDDYNAPPKKNLFSSPPAQQARANVNKPIPQRNSQMPERDLSDTSAHVAVSRLSNRSDYNDPNPNRLKRENNTQGIVSLVNQNGQKIMNPPPFNRDKKPTENFMARPPHRSEPGPIVPSQYFPVAEENTEPRSQNFPKPFPAHEKPPLNHFPPKAQPHLEAVGGYAFGEMHTAEAPMPQPYPWQDEKHWSPTGNVPETPKIPPSTQPGMIDHPAKIVPRPALFFMPQPVNGDEQR